MNTNKIIASALGSIYIFSLILTYGSANLSTQVLMLIASICALTVSLFPESKIESFNIAIGLLVLIIIGILMLLVLFIIDLTRPDGPDATAATMNAVFIYSLLFIGRDIVENSRKLKNQ